MTFGAAKFQADVNKVGGGGGGGVGSDLNVQLTLSGEEVNGPLLDMAGTPLLSMNPG